MPLFLAFLGFLFLNLQADFIEDYFNDAFFRVTQASNNLKSREPQGKKNGFWANWKSQNPQTAKALEQAKVSLGLIFFKKNELAQSCQKALEYKPVLKALTIFYPIHYDSRTKKYFYQNRPDDQEWESCLALLSQIETLIYIPHLEEVQTLISQQPKWRMYSRVDLDQSYWAEIFFPLVRLLNRLGTKHQLKGVFVSVAAEMERHFLPQLNLVSLRAAQIWINRVKALVPSVPVFVVFSPNGDLKHLPPKNLLNCAAIKAFFQWIDVIAPSFHEKHQHFQKIDWKSWVEDVRKMWTVFLNENCSMYSKTDWKNLLQSKSISFSEISFSKAKNYELFSRQILQESLLMPVTFWSHGDWDVNEMMSH